MPDPRSSSHGVVAADAQRAASVIADFEVTLARARDGSGPAFELIYRDLGRPVAAFLRAKGVADVEDATSEVFLAVFAGLSRFAGDQKQFRSWVFTIAHRRTVDHWRRRGRALEQVVLEESHEGTQVPSAEESALATLSQARVVELLARLTDDQRDVLTLRIVADLTVEQVAEVTGKRPGAVKALQRRGLAAVRGALLVEGVPL